LRCADSVSPIDRTGRTKDKTSHSSKIPMLRSRSASLSRPGSRCSRPSSTTDSQPTGNPESVVPSSGWKTHPNSDPVTTTDDRNGRRNSDSVAASGNGRPRGKSTVVNDNWKIQTNSESAVTSDNRYSNGNSPSERQALGQEYETVARVMTETLNLDCSSRTLGDVVEEGARAASAKDNIRPHSSFHKSDLCSVGHRDNSTSRRERRSYSLDRLKPWKETR